MASFPQETFSTQNQVDLKKKTGVASAPTFRLNGGLRESVSATYFKLGSLLSQLSLP
jgi:hypothetical protein